MRTCCICKKSLELSNFSLHRKRKDGLQPQCKECDKTRAKAYYRLKKTEKLCSRCKVVKPRISFDGRRNTCCSCIEAEVSRICTDCRVEKKPNKFKLTKNGDTTKVCFSCLRRRERQSNPERFRRKARVLRERYPEAAILRDSRKFDKKKGFEGDLDRSFIRNQISKGCFYCGENSIRMTLDRKNNEIGHTKENVIPACIRCNYIRGSMPFKAWMNLVPAVRQTKEKGLFGDWRSQPFNKKR